MTGPAGRPAREATANQSTRRHDSEQSLKLRPDRGGPAPALAALTGPARLDYCPVATRGFLDEVRAFRVRMAGCVRAARMT